MSTTGWVVLGVIAVIVVWVISIYNGLVAMGQRVSQAFADIDVQLRQRRDYFLRCYATSLNPAAAK